MKNNIKIWLTTDTHFGHAAMVPYCGRPIDFGEKILKNLEVVGPDDVLIHLGDFCIGNDALWHAEFMKRVAGKKWLVKGNHDHKSNAWYLAHGWDMVCAKFQDKLFGKNILFSHVPTRETNIDSNLFITEIFDINIHGHFHNTLHRLLEGKFIVTGEKERNKEDLAALTPKHKLLSIENTNYQPVLLDKFIKEFYVANS